MMFKLDYVLTGAGWAQVTIDADGQQHELAISYLHDSLEQLANATIALLDKGANAQTVVQTVVFMAEPGEAQLLLERENNEDDVLHITLRWFTDWQSRGNASTSQVLQTTHTTALHFAQEVYHAMDKIYMHYGEEGYKTCWIEHDFPMEAYEKLGEQLKQLCETP